MGAFLCVHVMLNEPKFLWHILFLPQKKQISFKFKIVTVGLDKNVQSW